MSLSNQYIAVLWQAAGEVVIMHWSQDFHDFCQKRFIHRLVGISDVGGDIVRIGGADLHNKTAPRV